MKTLPIRSKAHGKLNLFLRVLRKRPDGYHDIFSLFHGVKIHDELQFRRVPGKKCRILSKTRSLPKDGTNLIIRAFHLLKKETGFRGGLEVRVVKGIPLGGGMGGGSSDAACTFRAVNRLYRLGLSTGRLQDLALRLGADIPFFLAPAKSALVSGVGERIKPFRNMGPFYFLLIFFPKGLSTASVYGALALTPKNRSVTIPRFSARLATVEKLKRHFRNDLMPASFKLYPFAEKVYSYIQDRNFAVSQTGSGSTLFVADSSKGRLVPLARELAKVFGLKTVITQSL